MVTAVYPQQSQLTAEEMASTEGISGVKLSKDAAYVVYSSGPNYKTGDHRTSALWLAKTSKENSAHKLTDGTFHDYAAALHPVSSDIYFLSDRPKAGDPARIYKLSLQAKESDGLEPVIQLEDQHGINSFAISPDGNYLAIVQQHIPSNADGKSPISIWREKKSFAFLSLADLRNTSKSLKTLVKVDAHVEAVTWKPDSSAILYRYRDRPDVEARGFPVKEAVVSVDTGKVSGEFEYPISPGSTAVWLEDDSLAVIQGKSPNFCSANALWLRRADGTPAKHIASGIENDAGGILPLRSKNLYAVAIGEGLDTRIDVYDADTKLFTAWQSDHVVFPGFWEWDMTVTEDGWFVLALTTSSAVTGDPEQLWVGSAIQGTQIKLEKRLGACDLWFTADKTPVTGTLEWKSSDGETICGVYSYPKGADLKKLPTLISPHGGPYGRDTLVLSLSRFNNWRVYLATHGYLVVSPNYRGSAGRGDTFALAASGGMGTLEWDDIDTLITDLIKRGWADPDRLAMAGYSQGGFLSAWGCTRPGNKFKAGVVGAGVTDWGMLAATSDFPEIEAALGGGAPWVPGEPVWLKGSPIKDACHVTAPILFLHGSSDQRVPMSQAIALLRGIERVGKAKVKPELVVYPREGHIFDEKEHVIDLLKRVLAHLDKYL